MLSNKHNDIIYKIKKNAKVKLNKNPYLINKNYIIKFNIINNQNIIKINDSNNNKIIIGEYKIFGIYNKNTKLWIWGNAIPGMNKSIIEYIENIKSYNFLFENNNKKKYLFYYNFLSQDTVLIDNDKMIKWINQLLLYLSNDIYYFNINISNNNVQFITLTNIIEKYI
jgi:hypothetical protein